MNADLVVDCVVAHDKSHRGVIPNEVRNLSCIHASRQERFLVAALLGMTRSCSTVHRFCVDSVAPRDVFALE